MALTTSGSIFDFQYHPTLRATTPLRLIARVQGGMRVSAFSADGGALPFHAVVATSANEIKDEAYSNAGGTNVATLGTFPPLTPSGATAGPERPLAFSDGVLGIAVPSAGGLVLSLAGNESVRYAVPLNAGVWRSVAGAPWTPLSASPRYAQFVTTVPGDTTHVFVGERDGDAANLSWNQAGLWESRDAGQT